MERSWSRLHRPIVLYNLRFMPLKTRVWGAGKALILCGGLLLTYVVFAAGSMRIALKTRDVVVPQLAGMTVNDASAALAETGLSLRVEEGRRVDPKVPAGQVLAQEPASGAAYAPPAQRPRLDQRGTAVDDRAGARRGIGADGAAARDAGGVRRRPGAPRSDRRTTRPDRSWPRPRPPRASRTPSRCSSIVESAARPTSCRTSSA